MSLKIKESGELILFLSIVLIAFLVFSYKFFGLAGIKIVLGIAMMTLPFYFMLGRFPDGERFVFSILLGLTIFPALSYIIGLWISFKTSIILTWIIFISIALILIGMKKKNQKNPANV